VRVTEHQAPAGIPLDAVDFFEELECHNDRGWWTAQQTRWTRSVKEPMEALCEALAEEFGVAKVFRPHRDVRFSADKSPYKIHQGAVVATSPGAGYYVQVSGGGLMTGAGWYQPAPAQLAAFRESVLDEKSGAALATIVGDLTGAGVLIGGDQLKTSPRGVDPGHPRIALLRHRSMLASRDHGTPDWLETAEVVDRVGADWCAYRPLLGWFAAHLDQTDGASPRTVGE
jgi:uncharacterized protein (TIGR02453 family)